MKFIAQLISDIFHPILFFLIMPYLVVYRQTYNSAYAFKWTLFSSVFLVLGIMLLVIGRLRGVFSDEDITKREERYRFYVFSALLSFVYLCAALYFKGLFFSISVVALGIFFTVLLFWVVNYFIKSSVHVGVASAFVSTVVIMYGSIGIWLAVIILPLVIWSRLLLRKHTKYEIIAGAALGFVTTIVTYHIALLYI